MENGLFWRDEIIWHCTCLEQKKNITSAHLSNVISGAIFSDKRRKKEKELNATLSKIIVCRLKSPAFIISSLLTIWKGGVTVYFDKAGSPGVNYCSAFRLFRLCLEKKEKINGVIMTCKDVMTRIPLSPISFEMHYCVLLSKTSKR